MKRLGFTLIELLVALVIISLLSILVTFSVTKYLAKSRDATRKSDLQKMSVAMEDYYNDHQCYPPAINEKLGCPAAWNGTLDSYMTVPCDPHSDDNYLYLPVDRAGGTSDSCGGYRLLTMLESSDDRQSQAVGCGGDLGCGLGSEYKQYNYGVAQGIPLTGDFTGGGSDSVEVSVP